ncbi:hypothetical protein [Chitiniphilus eburneus]|uniref:Uncharacterized protein n=1 Tax=Chitiniphilus eburneus TaxID=2571148 RepID=A0A4U0QDB4_9NEIS|nr:hypothetical protein [Chitiniphilus eburneus]TJZ73844.1 hypothetical protein FAZ21_09500 [Chitiniphilus eburneus]
MRGNQLWKPVAAGLLALAMLGACAQQPEAARPLTLQGTLLLKGSAPKTMQVLQTASAQYQLSGVTPEQADTLQRQRVTVTGTLVRAAQPPLLPLIEVSRIEALK